MFNRNPEDRRARTMTNSAIGGAAGAAVMYYIMKDGKRVPVDSSGKEVPTGPTPSQVNQQKLNEAKRNRGALVRNQRQDLKEKINSGELKPVKAGENDFKYDPSRKTDSGIRNGFGATYKSGVGPNQWTDKKLKVTGPAVTPNPQQPPQTTQPQTNTPPSPPVDNKPTAPTTPNVPNPSTQKKNIFQRARDRFNKPKEPKIVENGGSPTKPNTPTQTNPSVPKQPSKFQSGMTSVKDNLKKGYENTKSAVSSGYNSMKNGVNALGSKFSGSRLNPKNWGNNSQSVQNQVTAAAPTITQNTTQAAVKGVTNTAQNNLSQMSKKLSRAERRAANLAKNGAQTAKRTVKITVGRTSKNLAKGASKASKFIKK